MPADLIPIRPPVSDAGPPAGASGPVALLLSAARVAELLGIGLRTVRTWDASGRLPKPIRIGATVRWRAAELADWAAAGCPDRQAWEIRQKAAARK